MAFRTCPLVFIGLWNQIHGGDLNHDYNVDIPSYDEYSDWEPLPTFVFENNSIRNKTKELSDANNLPEEKQEITEENKIENVFLILEEIKERLEIINEPLKVIKEHLNDGKELSKEIKEPLEVLNEPLKDLVLPEVIKESLENLMFLEPVEDDGKDILERDIIKNDVVVKIEPVKDRSFAGSVKAKGTVTVGANFGHESCHPISYLYPPFYYGPFYYPLPYYYPYLPPSNSHDFYVEFLKRYLGIPSKYPFIDREMEALPDLLPEESGISSHLPVSGQNELKVGEPFGGFVPASGRISIAAYF